LSEKPASGPYVARQTSPIVSLTLVIAVGLGWTAATALTRLCIESGIPYFVMVFWPNVLGAVIAGTWLLVKRRRVPLGWRYLKLYGLLGLLGNALPVVVIVFVAPRIPLGVFTIDMALEPAFTYGFALILALERFHAVRFFGLLLGLGGLTLIILPQAGLPSPDMVPWVALGLAAPLSWAILSVWIARYRPPEADAVVITFGLTVASVLWTLPLLFATGDWSWVPTQFGAGEGMMIAIAAVVIVTWVIAFECIRLAGPVFYAAWGYVSTLAGIVVGIVVWHEFHSAWVWAAAAVILAGLFLLNQTTRQARILSPE
jgi:drug/metabolite transporter (DMT)-like permease